MSPDVVSVGIFPVSLTPNHSVAALREIVSGSAVLASLALGKVHTLPGTSFSTL